VVLVYPPYHFKPTLHYLPYVRPTLVLAHLYAVLEEAGVDRLEAIDLDLEFNNYDEGVDYFLEEATRRVEKSTPDVVCLSCKAAQFPFSALFSRRYKLLHPEAKIVMGGWMPTLAPETVLRLSGCDAVVRGEGERALPELVKRIDEREWSIEGVSYTAPEGGRVVHNPNSKPLTREELDALPLPRYDVLPPMQRYQPRYRKRCFSVEASRGCPNHQCIFCWNSTRNCETGWRAKSPRRVVQEIRRLVDKYGAQVVFFTDDNFGAEPMWLKEFISLMKTEFKPGEVEYSASMRVDTLDPSTLGDLYRSGLRTAFHGIESGSPRHWETLRKNFDPKVTRQYIVDLVRKEAENGILPMCSFIMGFPRETEEDLDETSSLCRDLANLGAVFSLQILAPNEGTALFEDYPNLIEPFDHYREFGESENLSPELRAVFGERLEEFIGALPDFRLVKPSMPLDKFKEKCSLMIDMVSPANESNILKSHRFRALATPFQTSPRKEPQGRFLNILRRLLKSLA
jgi:radical SAM superfamily enzyme YgiQ (UPF0313 family)